MRPPKLAAFGVVFLLAASPAASQPQEGTTQGVTPGGLVWSVSNGRLVLSGTDGDERTSFALAPKEGDVLGADDSGARVTTADKKGLGGFAAGWGEETPEGSARFAFRDSSGNALAVREVRSLRGSGPAVLGAEVFSVLRTGSSWTVFRTNAAEEAAPLAKVPVEKVLAETGKSQRVAVHATPAGVLLELRGPYRAVYVDVARPDRFLMPDPAAACGRGGYESAFPVRGQALALVSRNGAGGSLRFERLSSDGKLEGSFDLGEGGTVHAMPGGGFLVLQGSSVRTFDEDARELSRAALPSGNPVAARLAGTRLGPEDGGAAWAELALVGNAAAFSPEGLAALRRDADGALGRLRQVADGDPAVPQARLALGWTLNAVRMFDENGGFRRGGQARNETDRMLRSAQAMAEAEAPRWFRRALAIPLLSRVGEAPPWVREALVESVILGEAGDELDMLPAAAYTPELAELVSAVDRSRIERFEKAHPLADALTLASGGGEEMPSESIRFHVPAARFPDLLLACLEGAGPIGFPAALAALGQVAWPLEARAYVSEGFEDDEAQVDSSDREAADARDAEALSETDAAGRVASLLLYVARSSDPDLRGGAAILSPYFGLPVDPTRWRGDVLARPGAATLALPSLLKDRTLPAAGWTRLFGETILAARKRSPDPMLCSDVMSAFQPDGPRDPYCYLLASVFAFGAMSESGAGPTRGAEVAAWAASPASPPEIRLHARIGSVYSGSATATERMAFWRDPELPLKVRQTALVSWGDSSALVEMAPELARELREERLSPPEERVLVDSLKQVDPTALARLAAEKWERGTVPLGDGNEALAESWTRALDAGAVSSRPELREALEKALDDPGAGPQAASLLAKTGNRAALPRLVFAIRTGCLE